MEQTQPGIDPDLNKDLIVEEVTAAPAGPSESTGVAAKPPVKEEAVAPVREALGDEVHNAKNTPAKVFVQSGKLFTATLDEAAREEGFLTIFMGNHKSTIMDVNELIQNWLIYRASVGMYSEGEIKETELNAAKANWRDWLAEKHPGVDVEDMERYCYELYEFVDNIQDGIKIRSAVMQEGQITNLFNRGSGIVSGDIVGKKPSAALDKKMSLADQMRRSSLNANQDLYEFDVLLRNSFAGLSIRRPNLLSLGSLIGAISQQVKGYVRQVNNPSPTLAYIAGIRAFWDYLAKLIVSCTVKDTSDFKALADSILLTDIDELAVGMLNAVYTRGVPLELRCLTPKCGWNELGTADPSRLIQVRKKIETPEESAVYANLHNRRIKLSREEMKKLQDKTDWKMETDRVYSSDKRRYFRIAAPTLTQAFETFDYFVSVINPRIQEMRSNTLDPKDFENQLTAMLTSISSAEYMHWVTEYVVLPESNTAGEPVVFSRDATNNDGFNAGIMSILNDDPEFGNELVKFIYNKSPFMSRIFTGVDHHECPKCKENSEGRDELKLGYTPVNAFMSFFTLTQLKLMTQTLSAANTNREALSD